MTIPNNKELQDELKRTRESLERHHEQHEAGKEHLREHAQAMEDLQEQMRENLEDAQMEHEAALIQHQQDLEHSLANAHLLQAERLAQRAGEVYRARMFEECLQTAKRSLNLDPANLRAHHYAALANVSLGHDQQAAMHREKQIRLLGSAHRGDQRAALEVLDDIFVAPERAVLLRLFMESFRSETYAGPVVAKLLEEKRDQEALQLHQQGPRTDMMPIVLGVEFFIRGLSEEGGRHFKERALRVNPQDRHVFAAEVTRAVEAVDDAVSSQAKAWMREALKEHYDAAWMPLVKQEAERVATGEAASKVKRKRIDWKKALRHGAIASGCLAVLFVAAAWGGCSAECRSNPNAPSPALAAISGAASLIETVPLAALVQWARAGSKARRERETALQARPERVRQLAQNDRAAYLQACPFEGDTVL